MNSSENLIDCLNTENHNNLIVRQRPFRTVTKKRAKCTKKCWHWLWQFICLIKFTLKFVVNNSISSAQKLCVHGRYGLQKLLQKLTIWSELKTCRKSSKHGKWVANKNQLTFTLSRYSLKISTQQMFTDKKNAFLCIIFE